MGKKLKNGQKVNHKKDLFDDHYQELEDLLENGDLTGAWSKLKKLKKEYQNHPAYWFLHGNYCEILEQLQQAEEFYLKSIRLDKTKDKPYIRLIGLYEKTARYDDAIEILKRGARDTAKSLEFYRWLNNFCVEHGRAECALEAIDTAKERFRGQGELYYLKGEASYSLVLYTTAIDYFRRSLEHHYEGRHIYLYLAESLSYCTYPEECLHFFRKSVIRNPDHQQVFELLYNTLLWQHKSGNEKLIAAVGWKKSMLSGDVNWQIQRRYLDLETPMHEEVLENWIKEFDDDPARDYEIFCDFYRNLALFKTDHESPAFDPIESLSECILTLQKIGAESLATYFQGWHAYMKNDHEKARSLLNLTLQSSGLPDRVKNGCNEGLRLLNEKLDTSVDDQPPEEQVPRARDGLKKYGTDLSARVRGLKHPPAFGLDEIVDRMANILASGPKRSLLLTGPSGAGKTAAVHQLAYLINSKECPKELKEFRIFQVSTSAILSGAKYIGQWQQRLEEVCTLGNVKKRVILSFEDIANVFTAGRAEGSDMNFADYLLPRMEQGSIILLGEIDSSQAQSILSRVPGFERLVTEVKIEEPRTEKVLEIIRSVVSREGREWNVTFDEEALVETINVTDVFMPYKAQPGKSLEIIRGVLSMWGTRGRKGELKITTDEVIYTFCETTGIPDFIIDRNQQIDLKEMQKFFSDRVLGQEEAIRSLVDTILQFKARLCDDRRPIRSFMFVGPTGVGKTESAKVLAEFLFGGPDRIVRLDMSEYSDAYSVSKLLGPHTGYGSKASRFLEQVRREPFSVVLLDEIEKAHPDIRNLLLQMLDEGVLSDSEGKPAFFRSAIIILTSNLGSRFYTSQSIGFGTESEITGARRSVLAEVKGFFSPEIFNRLDELICFRPLDRDVVQTIINREIGKVFERRGIVEKGLSVEVDPLVVERIIENGYDQKYGARHIKRAVEESVALPLARLVATTKIPVRGMVRINMRFGSPVADLVVEEGQIELERFGAELPQFPDEGIRIPDRGLRKFLSTTEERISSLKSKLQYDEVSIERDELETRMGKPTFWDDPSSANTVLRKYSDINRRIERIHRWERKFERIRSLLSLPQKKQTKSEISRAKSQAKSLLKDLESAEMEILLEGKHDFADAFLILAADRKDPEAIRWMLEVAGVYTKWAGRRGYRAHIFGEQLNDGTGKCSLLLSIEGMNAFGLLKNEGGLHRKIISRKSKKDILKTNHDCAVIVLADVEPRQDGDPPTRLKIQKVSPVMKGLKLKSMSRKVIIRHPTDNFIMEFFTDTTVDRDEKLPVDLFLSYQHYLQKKKTSEQHQDMGIWGSIVRTYETGVRSRIVDHASNIVTQNVKDFLSGKIDSLLIERLI